MNCLPGKSRSQTCWMRQEARSRSSGEKVQNWQGITMMESVPGSFARYFRNFQKSSARARSLHKHSDKIKGAWLNTRHLFRLLASRGRRADRNQERLISGFIAFCADFLPLPAFSQLLHKELPASWKRHLACCRYSYYESAVYSPLC